MAKAKGLFILLGILFFSILLGFVALRMGTNLEIAPKAQFNWKEYIPPSKTFKVKFPSLPQSTSKVFVDPATQEKRTYEMYVSQQDEGTVYMVSMITFPEMKSAVDNEVMLASVASDMITSNPKKNMVKTETGKFKGSPSLSFALTGENVHIDVKTFVVGSTLYILSRIAPDAAADKSSYDFFTDSFELTTRS